MLGRASLVLRRFTGSVIPKGTDVKPQPSNVYTWRKRAKLADYRIQRFEQPEVRKFYAPEWDLIGTKTKSSDKYSPLKDCRTTPEKWEYQNKVVWPADHIVPETGLPKPAEVYHCVENLHFAVKKMWYPCQFAWRMNVDEAIQQLRVKSNKGSLILADALEKAKERAGSEFYIDNPSNMFVAEAFSIQHMILKSRKRHARENWQVTRHRYIHLFVRLEEGDPPPFKRAHPIPNGWEKMRQYYTYLRSRELKYSI